jgi:membrane protein
MYITLQMYGENGLANHAAACSYGFLLSMAPMLLLAAFLIFYTFEPSPGAIIAFINTIPFLGNAFDEKWFSSGFFTFSRPSVPGIISVLSIVWAGRILALAIQRGLKIIFPQVKKNTTVKNTLVTLAIEVSVIVFVVVIIVSSRTAIRFYGLLDFSSRRSFFHFVTSHFGSRIFYITLLGAASYCVYLLIPLNSPRKSSAFQGALFCTLAYFCTVLVLGFILNKARYNFLYGTFGNLIIILINVYFFFTFFFIGAQLAFVTDYYEALLFSKLRLYKIKASEKKKSKGFFNKFRYSVLVYKFFHPSGNNLNKYFRYYKKEEIIFSHGDTIDIIGRIFYLLEGEAEITVSSLRNNESFSGIIKSDSFFGGIGYQVSEEHKATVRATSDVSVIVIPPALFDTIVKYDNNLDKTLIENMSHRLKINRNIA